MSRVASWSIRAGIAVMVLDHVYNGIWALASARNYYETLPGADPTGADGLLNQVLVRDLGAGRLTLALVLTLAGVWLDRRLLVVALGGAGLSGSIRIATHALSGSPEAWMNWFGYSAGVLIPIALLLVVARSSTPSNE